MRAVDVETIPKAGPGQLELESKTHIEGLRKFAIEIRRLTLSEVVKEPFRLFFPLAVFTGVLGVLVWPLYFGGFLETYPGPAHTRLMGLGFFGAFMFGFLGTALPRLLETQPFRWWQVVLGLGLFVGFDVANLTGNIRTADALCLMLLILFPWWATGKWVQRQDMPPPGFVLVAMAFVCGASGALIGFLSHGTEIDPHWLVLRPLLAYQGFVLLPILGVGSFLLPRFLGLANTQAQTSSRQPTSEWWAQAGFALCMGGAIIVSFFIETWGWTRLGHLLRFGATAIYLHRTVPILHGTWRGTTLGWALRAGLFMIMAGLLSVVIGPEFRVALLHILLVGGFGVVTLVVATRVVFGHSGQAVRFHQRNRWLWWAIGWMVLGMATRISGDFLPHIMVSHYNYGALCWILGVGIWAWKVLPGVLRPDAP